jgi:hypothetical protein
MLRVVSFSFLSRCAFFKNSQGLGSGKTTPRETHVPALHKKAAPPPASVQAKRVLTATLKNQTPARPSRPGQSAVPADHITGWALEK